MCVNLFKNSSRNIVCDNFFTSYNLARMLMDDHKLSLLGTVNKSRRFIPPQFLIQKRVPRNEQREVNSSLFAFSNNVTMCSYVPEKK